MVEEGQQAPEFELESHAGERVRLSRFRGRPVDVYFYPRDELATSCRRYVRVTDTTIREVTP